MSALAQTLFAKLAVVRMLVLGLIGVPVGMALVVVALHNPSLTLYWQSPETVETPLK